MKPAPFIYERPNTVQAALGLLADGRFDTKILAGGQSLVPMMNFRLIQPERLVDINALPDLNYIRREDDELVLGALARHSDVKASALVRGSVPLIAAAYEWVAHGPVRNRGTLAGNLCHADPASEMPSLMLALGAKLVVRSAAHERHIDAEAFFKGVYTTAVEPTELLMEIRIPLVNEPRGWGFHEVSVRKGDFAFASVCALMTIDRSVISTVAIAAAGVCDRALRLRSVESALIGSAPTAASFVDAARTGLNDIEIAGDARASAEYRRNLVQVLTRRALVDASMRARA